MTNLRQQTLKNWLEKKCNLLPYTLSSVKGDASFRQYFRLQHDTGSYIVMDAPPDKEAVLPFVKIAQGLRERGLYTPEVIASDIDNGFLLLTDFGDHLYLHELNSHTMESLYHSALRVLATLQTIKDIPGWTIPVFSKDRMHQELALCQEWFFEKHCKIMLTPTEKKILQETFDFIVNTSTNQPTVFCHRDYHSANLMVLPNEQVGILDFQDAFYGPMTYDLVSLLRDCYITWPEEMVRQLVLHYFEMIAFKMSADEFLYYFDIMGLQRHLKALSTFSRKYHRDHTSNYLQHIPRTVNYILSVAKKYPECEGLMTLMNDSVLNKMDSLCVE